MNPLLFFQPKKEENNCVENNTNSTNTVNKNNKANQSNCVSNKNSTKVNKPSLLNRMKNNVINAVEKTNNKLNSNNVSNDSKVRSLQQTVKLLSEYFAKIQTIIKSDPNKLKVHYIEDVYKKISSNKQLANIINSANNGSININNVNTKVSNKNNKNSNRVNDKNNKKNNRVNNKNNKNNKNNNNNNENNMNYMNIDDHKNINGQLVPGINTEKYTRRYVKSASQIKAKLDELKNKKLTNEEADEYLDDMLDMSN